MTYEEATKIIDDIIDGVEKIESFKITDWYYINELKRAAEAIRKDIPIKPKDGQYCPTCTIKLDRCGGLIDDCAYCGQKIDWSEENANNS